MSCQCIAFIETHSVTGFRLPVSVGHITSVSAANRAPLAGARIALGQDVVFVKETVDEVMILIDQALRAEPDD